MCDIAFENILGGGQGLLQTLYLWHMEVTSCMEDLNILFKNFYHHLPYSIRIFSGNQYSSLLNLVKIFKSKVTIRLLWCYLMVNWREGELLQVRLALLISYTLMDWFIMLSQYFIHDVQMWLSRVAGDWKIDECEFSQCLCYLQCFECAAFIILIYIYIWSQQLYFLSLVGSSTLLYFIFKKWVLLAVYYTGKQVEIKIAQLKYVILSVCG